MARGTRRVVFRVEVRVASAAATFDGDLLIELDYGDDPINAPRFRSLNAAVNAALAFVRRYQAVGIDAEARVMGQVVGVDATTPIRALAAGEGDEKVYAALDTVAHGLRQRVSLANSEASAAGSNLDDDIFPDVV